MCSNRVFTGECTLKLINAARQWKNLQSYFKIFKQIYRKCIRYGYNLSLLVKILALNKRKRCCDREGRVLLGLRQPYRPQASVPPLPPLVRGRDTLAGERGGGRVPIPTRGHTLWYSIFICTLWLLHILGECCIPDILTRI